MAKTVISSCDNCILKEGNCCKGCFRGKKENIFNHLTDKELDFLVKNKKQVQFDPGEVIISQNAQSNFGLCFKEGISKLSVKTEKNTNFIVKLITRREFICGGSMMPQYSSPFSITALSTVTCCMIEPKAFTKLFFSNKEFANQLLSNVSIERQYYINRINNITQKYAPGRIADTLLYLKNEVFNSNSFSVPLQRIELAELSSLALASFVRGLMDFKKSKIIDVNGNNIEILKEDALIAFSEHG